jgi:hypothetical protein
MDGLLVLAILVSLFCLAPFIGVDSRVRRDTGDPAEANDRAWWPNG